MKSYRQYCPVAHALDRVGDRWELLIVRELMLGQRRYTDLADALPGIGSNILTARLRELETSGIVRKTKLPPPWAVTVYELTEHGRELDSVLQALARWGARTLGAPSRATAGACTPCTSASVPSRRWTVSTRSGSWRARPSRSR